MKQTCEQKMQKIRNEIKNLKDSRQKIQTKIEILETQFSLLQRENLVKYYNDKRGIDEQNI